MGDSGQKDPEIYAEVVAKYPDRIRAIYIRDASADQRDLEVKAIAEQLTLAENIPTPSPPIPSPSPTTPLASASSPSSPLPLFG